MIINHNVSAVNAQRLVKTNQADLDHSMANLASGMRINRAADDASGLAVSEKMRTQIQGLRQATRNAEDGMSLVQTTEGYLAETTEIVQRIRVLAVQSANGIYTDQDRRLIQVEISQLTDEVDRIASQAEFNRMTLLKGNFSRGEGASASMWIHMGANMHQRERVYINSMDVAALGLSGIDIQTQDRANDVIGKADAALDRYRRLMSPNACQADAALDRIMKQRSDLGAYQNRLEHAAKGLMVAYENMQASESRIRDTDMAEEVVNLTTNQMKSQSSVAMLAQAGVRPTAVMQLLR